MLYPNPNSVRDEPTYYHGGYSYGHQKKKSVSH